MSSIAENETSGNNRVMGLTARNCEDSENTETLATKNLNQPECPPQAKKIKSGRGRTPMVAGQESLITKIRRKAERRKLALLADSQEKNSKIIIISFIFLQNETVNISFFIVAWGFFSL